MPRTMSSLLTKIWFEYEKCFRQLLTPVENELMIARGEEGQEEIVGKFGMGMYTLLYLKWITNKALPCSTGIELPGTLDGRCV